MSKFLKLTSLIINENRIKKIVLSPSQYNIHLIDHSIYGNFVKGTGYLLPREEIIHVCNKDTPQDYVIVSNWVSKN